MYTYVNTFQVSIKDNIKSVRQSNKLRMTLQITKFVKFLNLQES